MNIKYIRLICIFLTLFSYSSQACCQNNEVEAIEIFREAFWLNSQSAIGAYAYTRDIRQIHVPRGTISIIYKVTVTENKDNGQVPFSKEIDGILSTLAQENPYVLAAQITAQAFKNSDGSRVDFFIFGDTENAQIFRNGRGQSDNIFTAMESKFRTTSIATHLSKLPGQDIYFGFRNNNVGGWGTGGLQVNFEVVALVGKDDSGGWTDEIIDALKAELLKDEEISKLDNRDAFCECLVYSLAKTYTVEQATEMDKNPLIAQEYEKIALGCAEHLNLEEEYEKEESQQFYEEAIKLLEEKKIRGSRQSC